MSFSGNVKEEALQQVTSRRHCAIAELAALVSMCGVLEPAEARHKGEDSLCVSLKIQTENGYAAKKSFTLLKKTFNIYPLVSVRTNPKRRRSFLYTVTVERPEEAGDVLRAIKHPAAAGHRKFM